MGQVFKNQSDGAENKQPEGSVYFTMRFFRLFLFNILMVKAVFRKCLCFCVSLAVCCAPALRSCRH